VWPCLDWRLNVQATTYNWTPTATGSSAAPTLYNWDNAGGQNNWGADSRTRLPTWPTSPSTSPIISRVGYVTINLNQTITVNSLTLNDTGSYNDAYITIATGTGARG